MRRSALFFLILIASASEILLASAQISLDSDTQINLSPDDRKSLKVEYVTNETVFEPSIIDGDIQRWIGVTQDINYYELPSSDQWDSAQEYEIVLKVKPGSNRFTFKIESENLQFYYQPPLSDESFPKGTSVNDTHAIDEKGIVLAHRPINVVGSYAVYNRVTQRKIIHIFRPKIIDSARKEVFRPKIIDSARKEVWGKMSIVGEVLTIIVPQKYLDDATYPVIIDPTFGFTGIGGSQDANPWGNTKIAYRFRNQIGDGNITMISFYGKAVSTNGLMRAGFYDDSYDSSPPDHRPDVLRGVSEEVLVTTTLQWWNFTINSMCWNNSYYYLTIQRKPGFSNFVNYYDFGGDNMTYVREIDSYADGLSNPFTLDTIDFNYTRKGSAYGTVSERARVTEAGDVYPWIAIAIVLMCVSYLLVRESR